MKRIAGIFILSVSGFIGITEIVFIQMFITDQIDKPKMDLVTQLSIATILVVAIIVFLLVKLGLHLINNRTANDSIDEIGK